MKHYGVEKNKLNHELSKLYFMLDLNLERDGEMKEVINYFKLHVSNLFNY